MTQGHIHAGCKPPHWTATFDTNRMMQICPPTNTQGRVINILGEKSLKIRQEQTEHRWFPTKHVATWRPSLCWRNNMAPSWNTAARAGLRRREGRKTRVSDRRISENAPEYICRTFFSADVACALGKIKVGTSCQMQFPPVLFSRVRLLNWPFHLSFAILLNKHI